MVQEGIVARFRHHLLNICRVPPGGRVLVGLSGGPDSVALLHLLLGFAADGDLRVGAAHMDHGLRGSESDRDEEFVRELCSQWDVPLEIGHPQPGAIDADGPDLEARARRARMKFLREVTAREGYDYISLGHNRDDQAETLLLALLRGAGSAGLAGIPARRGRIVRPLLGIHRGEIIAHLQRHSVAYVTDSSNLEAKQRRNRIRLDLLPRIRREFNPGIVDVLARTAEILGDEDFYLDRRAAELLRTHGSYEGFDGSSSPRRVVLDLDMFDEPRALKRRALRLGYGLIRGSREDLAFDHVDSMLDPAEIPTGGGLDLPAGVRVRRDGGSIVMEAPAPSPPSISARGSAILPLPGALVREPFQGRIESRILGETASRAVSITLTGRRIPLLVSHAFIDYNKVELPLYVRSWRPGDRMRPLGMSGTKKIQDIFVDARVPRDSRSRVPLVLDSDHRVLWVAGVTVSDDVKLEGNTGRVIHLRVKDLVGSRDRHSPTFA